MSVPVEVTVAAPVERAGTGAGAGCGAALTGARAVEAKPSPPGLVWPTVQCGRDG